MKIKKYELVANWSAKEAEDYINEKIRLGWQPFGSLSYTFDPRCAGFVYVQALVLYEDNE